MSCKNQRAHASFILTQIRPRGDAAFLIEGGYLNNLQLRRSSKSSPGSKKPDLLAGYSWRKVKIFVMSIVVSCGGRDWKRAAYLGLPVKTPVKRNKFSGDKQVAHRSLFGSHAWDDGALVHDLADVLIKN